MRVCLSAFVCFSLLDRNTVKREMLNPFSKYDSWFQSSPSASLCFRLSYFADERATFGGRAHKTRALRGCVRRSLKERRVSEIVSPVMKQWSACLNSHLTPLIQVDFFNNGTRLTQSSGRQADELPCQSLGVLHSRLNSQSAGL